MHMTHIYVYAYVCEGVYIYIYIYVKYTEVSSLNIVQKE